MKLTVRPNAGYELVGLYGVPGDMVKRTKDGGLSMTIETIFLSKDKGGIYFAFKRAGAGTLPPKAGPMGSASLSYVDTQRKKQKDALAFSEVPAGKLPLGLARGLLLVDEVTTLKKASVLHGQQNKTEEAFRIVRALRKKLEDARVTGLNKELALVKKLDMTLTKLSGHQGEAPKMEIAREVVSGMPR
jgi:hypothetical protein